MPPLAQPPIEPPSEPPSEQLFVSGRQLAGAFYAEVVAGLVGDVPHAAALLGWGSDVLGYDTARSTDHGWGPRLQIFVAPGDVDVDVAAVAARVDAGLPETFRGWPTRFGWDDVPPRRWIDVVTLDAWLEELLGFVPRPRSGGSDGVVVAAHDWLATLPQRLLEVTEGEVFHDGPGELTAVREALAWYPEPVWLWLLADRWERLAREEAFVGRTAEVGDDLGSRLIAARQAHRLMELCFLLERRYAPYAKWLGTAFARLDAAAEVGPALTRALAADEHACREQGLCDAYEAVARRFNALGLVDPVDPSTRQYHGRPFRVLRANRFATACRARLSASDRDEMDGAPVAHTRVP